MLEPPALIDGRRLLLFQGKTLPRSVRHNQKLFRAAAYVCRQITYIFFRPLSYRTCMGRQPSITAPETKFGLLVDCSHEKVSPRNAP